MSKATGSPIDVVWLKKDVRLHDHGPLHQIVQSNRQCIILYLYEPDQLSEKTVHGSHIAFVNEGLLDLDLRLSGKEASAANATDNIYEHKFQCITVAHACAAVTLRSIHKQRPINQIFCHMESGHLKSFARDKAVRSWCRLERIPIKEINQTGVTRCLSDRDDFASNFNKFLGQPMYATPTKSQLEGLRSRLINIDTEGIELHGRCYSPMKASDMQEIPEQHRCDRIERQIGGESNALDYFQSFLSSRGANYSTGISSPNTSWTTGSRLSPYLTWGNISLRYVIALTKRKQEELRAAKKNASLSTPSPWLRSLASFQSRMHWRSHFIQKLETQPTLEVEDQCLAFSHLRRQPGDFNETFYDAWCEGRTGYPFVDACMRCLIKTGWLNFRMRAMLVSFATYNLWLDWKKISYHLARVFLDYEPGIHYPQLQMQAGTTGINAMRVYNVTKQGHDQDPQGKFIRQYVSELVAVPDEYIHEPQTMPVSLQRKCGVFIGDSKAGGKKREGLFQFQLSTATDDANSYVYYPSPIVDEKVTAKTAKDKLSAVRKQASTKREAEKVYLKHGSRRNNGDRDGVKAKALNSNSKRVKVDTAQQSLLKSWNQSKNEEGVNIAKPRHHTEYTCDSSNVQLVRGEPEGSSTSQIRKSPLIKSLLSKQHGANKNDNWNCIKCTYLNDKPYGLVCSMCGSVRSKT